MRGASDRLILLLFQSKIPNLKSQIDMTRFIHDQFAKDYLEELLSPYGEVQAPRRVAGEVRQIDVWFAPALPLTSDIVALGNY